MAIFWTIITLMIVVALLFAALPLLWHRSSLSPSTASLSLDIYKDQLRQLSVQQQTGEITADDYEQMRLEYEKSLLSELPADGLAEVNNKQPAWRLALMLLVLIPVVAVFLYGYLGNWRQLAEAKRVAASAQKLPAEIAALGSVDNIIHQLKQRVEQYPDSRGWVLLGRLYMKTQRFPEAVAAFARADQLTPRQPDILIAYAEAWYWANHQAFNPQARALLKTSLQLRPNQPEVINLLAVDAFQQQNYQQAVAYWEQLLPHYPPNSQESQALLNMIAEAQKRLASFSR